MEEFARANRLDVKRTVTACRNTFVRTARSPEQPAAVLRLGRAKEVHPAAR